MKYAKGSNQLCSSTGDSSVLLCLMSKQCIIVACRPACLVLEAPVFDVSNSVTAQARMINNNIQNYQLLVHCIPIKHQDYPNYKTSIIRRIHISPIHIAQFGIVLTMTYTGTRDAKQS